MYGYPEGATCELPLEWRLGVLEVRVRAAVSGPMDLTVIAADALPLAEYGALMAEIYSRGEDFPVVLVDGAIVCASGLDPAAVMSALSAQ
jgi:hypothetical protein